MNWSRIELSIECKVHPVSQDPFDDGKDDLEGASAKREDVYGQILSYADLVFSHQQRTHHYMVLFLGHYARIVRFDRSGIVITRKLDYSLHGLKLSNFFARFAHLDAEGLGQDSSAIRLEHDDPMATCVKALADKGFNENPKDHIWAGFHASLDATLPWWKVKIYDEPTKAERWAVVGKPNFQAPGLLGRGTRGYMALLLDNDGNLPLDADGNLLCDERGKSTFNFKYLKDSWRVGYEDFEKEGEILSVLNAKRVRFIPTLRFHGDIPGQATKSYTAWHEQHPGQTCPLKPHQHYRLVVDEIGKPLSEFVNGIQLVCAMYCVVLGEHTRRLHASNVLVLISILQHTRERVAPDTSIAISAPETFFSSYPRLVNGWECSTIGRWLRPMTMRRVHLTRAVK